MKNLFKHWRNIVKHRRLVLKYCTKCGLFFRGLVHDLSKYSPAEFFEGVKYYSSKSSSTSNCRKENGYSLGWLHHKAKNKHHLEYWYDNKTRS